MQSALARPSMDRGRTMAPEYPRYADRPVRAASATRTSSDTSIPSSTTMPVKGILKHSKPAQDSLAARFQLGPRQPTRYVPVSPRVSPPGSFPTDDNWETFELDTDESASSELSTNTQATSVASESTVMDGEKSSPHMKYVRHVPLPTVGRFRVRPRRSASDLTRTTSQVSRRSPTMVTFKEPEPLSLDDPRDDLLDRVNRLEDEARLLRDIKLRLAKDLDLASEKLTAKTRENKEMQTALKQEKASKEIVMQELEEERKQLDEARSNSEYQKGLLSEAEKQSAQHANHEDTFVRQVAALETAEAALEERIDAREREIIDLAAERNHWQAEAEQLKAQLTALTAEPWVEQKEKLEEAQHNLQDEIIHMTAEHQSQIKIVMAETDEQIRVAGEAKEAQVQAFNEERNALQSEIAALRCELDELKKEHDALKLTADELRNAKDGLQADKDGLQTEKEDLEIQLSEMSSAKGGLEVVRETLEAKITELEATIADLEAQVRATKDSKDAMEQALKDQAEADLTVKQARIDDLSMQLAGSTDANVELAAEKMDLGTQLNDTRDKLSAAEAALNSATELGTALQAELGELTAKTVELETNLEARTVELATANAEIDKLREQITGFEDKSNALQAEIENLQAVKMTLEEEKEKIQTHAAELEDGTGYNTLKVELEGKIAELQPEADKVPGMSQVITDLQTRIAELQPEADRVAPLTEEKTNLETKVNEIQTQADQVPLLTEQNTTLTSQLAQAEGATKVLKENIENLQSQLAHAQARSLSRSSSRRSPSKSGKKHERSSSTSSSLVFVRKPLDKVGSVYITTRESLDNRTDK